MSARERERASERARARDMQTCASSMCRCLIASASISERSGRASRTETPSAVSFSVSFPASFSDSFAVSFAASASLSGAAACATSALSSAPLFMFAADALSIASPPTVAPSVSPSLLLSVCLSLSLHSV